MSCDLTQNCCSEKPSLQARSLLSPKESAELEALFKTLANQTRLRMLHALAKAGEMCVTDLAHALAMKPAAISNQLQRLVDKGMAATRRNGNNVYYRIVDRCVISLLDSGLCIMEDANQRTGSGLRTAPVQNLHAEQVR
jgi:ArsR family transcriptional regulator, lead/cadmium/zinc/bismuth-responsive transcriptional repressor